MYKYIIDGLMLVLFFIFAKTLVESSSKSRLDRLRTTILNGLGKNTDVKYSLYSDAIKGIDVKMDALDKFHLKYVERPQLKQYFRFANVYLIILVMLIILIVSSILIVPIVGNIVTALVLGGIASSIPLMILDLMGKQMSEKARREVYNYISSLRTWSNVKSDILFIFEKASDDVIGPLSIHTKQMVVQIRNGLSADVALEILRLKVNNQYFDTFILNMTQAFQNQGDLTKLLSKLEKEAFSLEKAYNNRKFKTLVDRIQVFGLMIGTLVIAIYLIGTNESVRNAFVLTITGQLVFMVCTIAFAFGVFLQFKITDFDH